MSLNHHSWEEITDKDEIAKILDDINNQPLEFAPQQEVDIHGETVEKFVELVLDCGWAFISDESSLYDFGLIDDVTKLEAKIKEVFGVDVSDIEDKNLLKIFERIDSSKPLI
ncbi:hypothetical protein [Gloeocapsopsis sp. IPPAS B-1203]|uniref:hypothetical protein n=1 Tax=Gloeocapsopsis sp. IPPAS B-1203 TaxID=2049454 RepID=UPI000C19177A|nr:hypothetical protein [Gloeocapsopsis sp. IPPAS B-1203]PIG92228.1 hypothetical protein CSQ79_16470 [Gloeocapsopsis sp. IPPAS B-1203]